MANKEKGKSKIKLCLRFRVEADPRSELFFTDFCAISNKRKLQSMFKNAALDARREGIRGKLRFDGVEIQTIPADEAQRRPHDHFAADPKLQISGPGRKVYYDDDYPEDKYTVLDRSHSLAFLKRQKINLE